MADRWDNLSTEDLAQLEAATRAELDAMEDALKERLLAACPVKIGKTYRIGPPDGTIWPRRARYIGRTILVRYLKVDRELTGLAPGPWEVSASGPLKRPKPDPQRIGFDHGRFTCVHPDVLASRLDLSTESDP